MAKQDKHSAFAIRAFTALARNVSSQNGIIRLEICIHRGSGECVCFSCEHAKKVLDTIGKAGKR